MELIIIFILIFISIMAGVNYFFSRNTYVGLHLPSEIKEKHGKGSKLSDILDLFNFPMQLADHLIVKLRIPMDGLKNRLNSANRPISPAQFLLFKFLMMSGAPIIAYVIFRPQPPWLLFASAIGFVFPEIWLNKKIAKRRAAVLKDLPHVIDLLNICVGAGLDFMLAVNRVVGEFKPCAIIEELKLLLNELQMGSSRRDALRGLALRINSPEISSFVRTLLQADRVGTPIGEALKMQSEEIRMLWFQRGERMALKAPLKLLLPLLVFILPVVLIIVAGPIFIQFSRGGGLLKV